MGLFRNNKKRMDEGRILTNLMRIRTEIELLRERAAHIKAETKDPALYAWLNRVNPNLSMASDLLSKAMEQ